MDRRIFAVAMLMLLAAPFVVMASDDADAEASSSTASLKPSDIGEDTKVVASGTCGTATGAAKWSYSRSESNSSLMISDGSVDLSKNWKIEKLTIGETEATATDIAGFTMSDILTSRVALTVNGSVSATAGVINSLNPTSATVNGTSVPGSFFSNCVHLATVKLADTVTSIGAQAFSGCTLLTSFDVNKAAVDQTAFKGCTRLTEFKAVSGGNYTVVNGMLYSDNGATLYLSPTGKTGNLKMSDIGPSVKKIFLGYADIDFVLDVNGNDRSIAFEKTPGLQDKEIKGRGFVYSSQGMSSCDIDHTISAGSSQVDVFTINYVLYKGWAVDESLGIYTNATAKLDTGKIVVTAKEDPDSKDKAPYLWMSALPMGVKTLRYSDLAGLDKLGDWSIKVSNLPSSSSGIIKDIDSLDVAVTGYLGAESSAELDGTLYYRGIVCKVSSVSMTYQTIGKLTDLTVGEGVAIGKKAFANLTALKSVKADHLASVGDSAFEYCTGLTTVSFRSCTEFGQYAFQNCWGLRSIDLGPSSIVFKDNALRGCRSLNLLTIGMDAKVEGVSGIPLLHYDMSDTSEKTFEVVGDYVRIYWYFSSKLFYNTVNDESTATEAPCYRASDTIIPISDEIYVWQKAGSPAKVTMNMVVYDYGMGLDAGITYVPYGEKISKPSSVPGVFGYRFLFWSDDGANEYRFEETATQSKILVAIWSKDDPIDPLPMYIGIVFGAAVIGTFAVLAIARRMNK